MSAVRVIAALTCKEAVRRRVLQAAAGLGVAFLVLYAIGLHFVLGTIPAGVLRQPLLRREGLTVLTLMGLYAVNWLCMVMTILVSVDTIAGEVNSGVIQAVVTKPLRRWEVIAGKWAGFGAMLSGYIFFMAGGLLLLVRLLGGQTPPHVPQAIGLMWLESMLLLAVTFRAGASLSTLAAGVVVFGAHIFAFLGGWVEEFGSLAHSQTAVNIGILASVFMPSEVLWRRAAFGLQGPIVGAFGRGPFNVGSVPSDAMVVYAAAYMTAALALAIRRFSRRDL